MEVSHSPHKHLAPPLPLLHTLSTSTHGQLHRKPVERNRSKVDYSAGYTRVDCNLVTVRVIACSCLVRTAPLVLSKLYCHSTCLIFLSHDQVSIIYYFGDKVLYTYKILYMYFYSFVFFFLLLLCASCFEIETN